MGHKLAKPVDTSLDEKAVQRLLDAVKRAGVSRFAVFTDFGPIFLLGQLSCLYARLALAGSLLLFAAGRLYSFGHLPKQLPLACVCWKLPAIKNIRVLSYT